MRLFPLLTDRAAAHVVTNIASDILPPCAHQQLMQNFPGTEMPSARRIVRLSQEFLEHLLWYERLVALLQLSAVAQLQPACQQLLHLLL